MARPSSQALLEEGRLAAAANLPPADELPEPVEVDLLFLYTPEAIEGAGGEQRLRQRLLEALDRANFIYTNSRIHLKLNAVHAGRIAYTESGSIETDLNRLANSLDVFSAAPGLRADYKADLVCLITETENLGIGGIAWDIPPLAGDSRIAYTAVRRHVLGKQSAVLAHELGHLLGCAHDREHAGDLNSAFYRQKRSYIFGYRFEVQGVTYIDVMAYEPGIVLPFFSNPRLDLDGAPLGVPEGQPLPADNARAVNETVPYVARYMQALSRIEFDAPFQEVTERSGPVTLRLVRKGNLNTSTRVAISVLPESTARAASDYLPPPSLIVRFDTNQALAQLEIPLIADEVPEGPETILLRLTAPEGSHGIGWQGETTVSIQDAPPLVVFPGGSLALAEQNATFQMPVRFTDAVLSDLARAQAGNPRISWRLEGDSAVPGEDFVSGSGELQVSMGPSGCCEIEPISIQLLDDNKAEPDRMLKVIVQGRLEAQGLFTNSYLAVTNVIKIVDDDRPGSILSVPGASLNADGGLNVAVRDDGKLLVWGGFSRLNSSARSAIALLDAEGRLDPSFQPPEFLLGHRRIEGLANAQIYAVQPLADGKFLAAGNFSRIGGKPRTTMARLNRDGSFDESFGATLVFDGAVFDLAVQKDGKIVIGGEFEKINGARRPFIARLNADGSVDETFQPAGGPASDWTVLILAVTVQPGGKILMGGYFERVDGVSSLNIARLLPDGRFDSSFKLRNASGPVCRIELQADGRIVLGGLFDSIAGRLSRKITRLNADGTIDPSFRPPHPNGDVREVLSLPDGRLVVSGTFTRIGNLDRRFLAVLEPDGTVSPNFDFGSGPDDLLGHPGLPLTRALSAHAEGSLCLSGQFQKMNGLNAPGALRVRIGNGGSSLSRIERLGDGEMALTARVLPGGIYPLEATGEFGEWAPIGVLRGEGFSREALAIIRPSGEKRFFRLRNP